MYRFLFAALLVGCGASDGGDSGEITPTTDETTEPPVTYDATWAGVEQLFVDSCDSCHPATNGIDLHADITADIASGSGAYVIAGDPDNSLLWKVIGTSTLSFMPTTGQLPTETVDHVRVWIEDGAVVD